MEPISIMRGRKVLAHHTTEHCRSSYGQAVWSVEVSNPKPGPAEWRQGEAVQPLQIVGVRAGWLIVRQADGLLCGIIWSDGTYYANVLETVEGVAVKRLRKHGLRVRGTIRLPDAEGSELGAVLC